MSNFRLPTTTTSLLRRAAATSLVGVLALVSAPLAAGADGISPVVNSVSVTGADLSVTWTVNVADATSVDAILYDNTGTVIEDDSFDPSVTSDTFYSLAPETGYYVVVTATDAAGTTTSQPSDSVDVVEGPAVITSQSGSNGSVTVTWTNTSPDATGLDVILYDNNGNVVADDTLSGSATSDTFANVADGQGYYVVITTHTPSGDFDSDSGTSFTLAGGVYSTDTAVSFNDLSCVDGTVSVSWSSNSPDATGYDVILLDANGNVISQVTVDPSTTSYDFTGVADGTDYSVEVVAHTPVGDLSATSWNFSIANGQLVQIPVDPPVVIGGTGELVDPSTVVVTALDGGGWTISWNELSDATTNGYYLVTDDQGDTCTVDSSGTAGAPVSCDLAALSDPTVTLSGLSVTYYDTTAVPVDEFGSVTPQLLAGGVAPVQDKSVSTPRSTPVNHVSVRHEAVASAPLQSSKGSIAIDWLVGFGGLLLASAAALMLRRRSVR